MYVDAHCHIDRYADPALVLSDAELAGVKTIAVTESPADFRMLQVLMGERHNVKVALGLHPLRAPFIRELDRIHFRELLDRTQVVGEVGLDGSIHGKTWFDRQVQNFEWVLSSPSIESKVLSVHSRGAEELTVDLLAQASTTAILHWYSGPLGVADRALAAGFFFSINPAMLESKNGRRIIARIPETRILTETDGPYAKRGNREIMPSDIPHAVSELASLWAVSTAAAARQIQENFERVFRIPSSENAMADWTPGTDRGPGGARIHPRRLWD